MVSLVLTQVKEALLPHGKPFSSSANIREKQLYYIIFVEFENRAAAVKQIKTENGTDLLK